MFKERVVITLLCVLCTLVHRVHNNTESSRDFLRKCCFGNIDTINDRKNVTMISYDDDDDDDDGDDDMSCCTACFENKEYVEGRKDAKRFCLKACLKDETFRKVWSYNGSGDDDDDDDDSVNNNNNTIDNICSRINNESLRENRTKAGRQCDSVFTSLNFWGANIVIFANIIYIIPYLIVVLVYSAVPGLGSRAYDKAVICFNASQIILNGILISIGACILCRLSIHSNVYIFSGLTIMFLTISSTFWLFVICIDMTSVITRFDSTSSRNRTNQQSQERKKFFTYAAWTWGGSLLPTALACVAELSPLLPKSSPIRPNFQRIQDGANLPVIIYVATFPAITCLANSVLFCYTSYRMILIQRSTTLATANNNATTLNVNKARRKRYFLFFRLYLLMDTPWITSALAAAFTELWVLKFFRMIQPILMLLAILPPRTVSRIFTCNSVLRNLR